MNQWCIELRLLLHIFFLACVAEFGLNNKKSNSYSNTLPRKRFFEIIKFENKKNVCVQMRACWSCSFFFISIHFRKYCKFVQWKQRKKPKKLIFFSFYFKTIKSMNNFLMTWDSEFNELELWLCQMFDQMNLLLCVCVKCQLNSWIYLYNNFGHL